MGAEALIDLASLDSAASAVEATAVETPSTEVNDTDITPLDTDVTPSTEVVDDKTEGKETETHNADGTEKTPEEQEAFKTKAAAEAAKKPVEPTKATPDSVRKALKALRDSDPKSAAIVKELHGAFERFNAYKTEFPTVQAAKEAKAFIEAVGGEEGYKQISESMDAVKAADELLHNSDPQIWKNVIEDLKASGHPEAFANLAPAYLKELKELDSDAFYKKALLPLMAQGLKESKMDVMLKTLNEALVAKNDKGEVVPDVAKLSFYIKHLTEWYKDTEGSLVQESKDNIEDTPERKKFLAEKAEFEKTKTADQQEKIKTWETNVATEADKQNNVSLSKSLGTFLKLPYFKDFPRETKIDIGNGIKDALYATLRADKAYQAQMSALWKGGNTPQNNQKIQDYHKSKVDAIAQEIVTKVIQKRYPGYAKGGSAAGRVAAATEKKTTDAKVSTQSVVSGKPVYVASRPTNLIRETVVVNGKEYSSNDLITMQIAGRGFVKTGDGKGYRLVTWRK